MTPEDLPNDTPDQASAHSALPEGGSLHDYIQRHLQSASSEPSPTSGSLPPLPIQAGPNPFGPAPAKNGLLFHHLDSQLAGGHLEKYLPSPMTRYPMMRDRLLRELGSVEEMLRQFQHLAAPECRDKVTVLQARATLLRERIMQLDEEISRLNPFQGVYYRLAPKTPAGKTDGPSRWRFFFNPNRKLHQETAMVQDELGSLHQILQNHLHDPSFSPEELSQLINQYDHGLCKAEAMIQKLQDPQALPGRLGQWLGFQS